VNDAAVAETAAIVVNDESDRWPENCVVV